MEQNGVLLSSQCESGIMGLAYKLSNYFVFYYVAQRVGV